MKLLMHILRENKKLNIDNTRLNDLTILNKLDEEYKEVVKATMDYHEDKTLRNLKEIVRETFDLIQVCILILWRCHRRALTIDEPNLIKDINIEHKDKLSSRGWIIETGIEIDVKE